MKEKKVRIGVLGLWHLGCVYTGCLAKLGFEVVGFDENREIVENLKKGLPPIEEPGLTDLLKKYSKKTVFFTTNSKEAISGKDFIFVTYDIPVDDNDKVDLTIVDNTVKELEKNLSENTTVVISSQLPAGTSRKIITKLRKKQPSTQIIYFPENLRLGTAIESFLKPDRIVIGSDKPSTLNRFEETFRQINVPFFKIGLESAEMVKHMLNSYLATLISFSSEISDFCEFIGANMNEVVKAVKTDRRVSPNAPLNPGLGFAGGTLGRDLQTLKKLGLKYNYRPLLTESVYEVNKKRLSYLVKKVNNAVSKKSKNNLVGLLGLTYKPQTNTLRRSTSLELASLLKQKGFRIRALDPAIKSVIKTHSFIEIEKSPQKFFKHLDLVVLMTDWEDFRKIDWQKATKEMEEKRIIDTKNFLDSEKLIQLGFQYQGVGI